MKRGMLDPGFIATFHAIMLQTSLRVRPWAEQDGSN